MPPAAAEREIQRGGIGISIGLCLDQRDARLLPTLLGLRAVGDPEVRQFEGRAMDGVRLRALGVTMVRVKEEG